MGNLTPRLPSYPDVKSTSKTPKRAPVRSVTACAMDGEPILCPRWG